MIRGVGGGGRVVIENRGGSAKVVTGIFVSKVDSVLRLNKESIPVFGLRSDILREIFYKDSTFHDESKHVNEARCAKDTLRILFWGVMHKRFGVITSWDNYPVMSSSSIVTYTSVYTDSKPGRVFWGADEELSDGGSSRVIIYGYDGLLMKPVAPPSMDYVPGPEHPPSPDYVPGPEHPPSPVEPLPADASPTTLSPGYVADSDPDEDPEEDPEEDHADYPADGGDDDDEPSDDDHDDDDTDDEDEKPFEDENYDEEEDEHLALADSSTVPVVDHVPSAGDTEAFETDESAPTPRSPQTMVPFA
ncbi:hypothetical protein Tco_0874668 [Tanacetum coccineum]|uniref:Uncharacterized protein n=1 Tax=Tanacetum coccineum TaxID=301880 RepID=A0ABQ5BQ57_9ASTR